MSECVVRMEMPENCECCPMVYTADVPGYHWCAALEQEVEQGLSRPKECPIICQLPKGHGRLVDADDCIKHLFTELVKGEISNSEWCNIRQCMNEETTIVPAEAERSET